MSSIQHLKTPTGNEYAAAPFRQQVAVLLKTKRETDGLSLRAVEALVGIPYPTLHRIEHQDVSTRIDYLERVCNWLGMTLTLVPSSESL